MERDDRYHVNPTFSCESSLYSISLALYSFEAMLSIILWRKSDAILVSTK